MLKGIYTISLILVGIIRLVAYWRQNLYYCIFYPRSGSCIWLCHCHAFLHGIVFAIDRLNLFVQVVSFNRDFMNNKPVNLATTDPIFLQINCFLHLSKEKCLWFPAFHATSRLHSPSIQIPFAWNYFILFYISLALAKQMPSIFNLLNLQKLSINYNHMVVNFLIFSSRLSTPEAIMIVMIIIVFGGKLTSVINLHCKLLSQRARWRG